jgi:hypothetical protein
VEEGVWSRARGGASLGPAGLLACHPLTGMQVVLLLGKRILPPHPSEEDGRSRSEQRQPATLKASFG